MHGAWRLQRPQFETWLIFGLLFSILPISHGQKYRGFFFATSSENGIQCAIEDSLAAEFDWVALTGGNLDN
jgi:hypothetical protein